VYLHLIERISAARIQVLLGCALSYAVIAAGDWFSGPDSSLGILYIAPLVVSSVVLPRWQIVICGIVAAMLREQLGTSPWEAGFPLRITTGLLAFLGAALLVAEVARLRRVEAESNRRLMEEGALRLEAEEDARVLIESSPAAILTVNADGSIDLANDAARQLLCFDPGVNASRNIRDYFPTLAEMLKSPRAMSFVRTMVEARGHRGNGEMFFAHMWLSSYHTAVGLKLAAVVADVSEQVRDREELGLRQLLTSSRIIAGAVSHEIRNLAAAAAALHDNIEQAFGVGESEDFRALGRLIQAMRKLSSSEFPASTEKWLTGVDLNGLLKELNIILLSGSGEGEVKLEWEVADRLPRVRADHSGLLQVFLNLTQNSRRALRGRRNPRITITAYQIGGSVVVRVADNGPGIAAPEALFQPFQHGATSAGLGLYVSRAIVRTYGGELKYAKRTGEACFLVELPAMTAVEVGVSA
jgi:two-component system sensor kinase FixL